MACDTCLKQSIIENFRASKGFTIDIICELIEESYEFGLESWLDMSGSLLLCIMEEACRGMTALGSSDKQTSALASVRRVLVLLICEAMRELSVLPERPRSISSEAPEETNSVATAEPTPTQTFQAFFWFLEGKKEAWLPGAYRTCLM